MPTTVPRRLVPSLVAVVAAPAVWLEQARGRKRFALIAAYVVVAAAIGVLAWRWLSLREIPGVPEPFDLRTPAARVPDDQNAYVPYRDAVTQFSHVIIDALQKKGSQAWAPATGALWQWKGDWALAGPALRDYLEASRDALNTWRKGAERDFAVSTETVAPIAGTRPPRNTLSDSLVGPTGFSALARLEAARLVAAGDMAGAWGWYRSLLRSYRHVAANDLVAAEYIEGWMQRDVLIAIERWAADPRTSAALLRRALADAAAIDDLPLSEREALRASYRQVLTTLDRPPPQVLESAQNELTIRRDEHAWYSHAPGVGTVHWFVQNEPERSRRVARLVFANWLHYVELPRSQRASLLAQTFSIPLPQPVRAPTFQLTLFEPVASTPPPGNQPADPPIVDWIGSTLLLKRMLPDIWALAAADAQRPANQQKLTESLAREIVSRERGIPAEAVSDDMVAQYLHIVQSRPAPRTSP